jgi:hypothetical protein
MIKMMNFYLSTDLSTVSKLWRSASVHDSHSDSRNPGINLRLQREFYQKLRHIHNAVDDVIRMGQKILARAVAC